MSRKRPELVVGLTTALEEYTLPLLQGDHPEVASARANVERLISDGYLIQQELARLVHREISARTFDRRGMVSWIKTATKMTRESVRTIQAELKRQDAE